MSILLDRVRTNEGDASEEVQSNYRHIPHTQLIIDLGLDVRNHKFQNSLIKRLSRHSTGPAHPHRTYGSSYFSSFVLSAPMAALSDSSFAATVFAGPVNFRK